MTRDWLSEVGGQAPEGPPEGTIPPTEAILNYLILAEYHRVSSTHLLLEASVASDDHSTEAVAAIEAAFRRLVPQPVVPTTTADQENFALFESAFRVARATKNTNQTENTP